MLNILEFIFLGLAVAVTFTGILISKYEKHVPAFIIKGYKYGSFAYQGSGGNFLHAIEIPKSYYKHFYLFSSICSAATLCDMILVYFYDYEVHSYVSVLLRLILEQDVPSVSATAALIAMTLFSIQCARRFYETYCLQVFAKSSKMNLSHYLAGIIHYFGCIVTVFGQAPLMLGNQSRETIKWNDTYTTVISVPCILTFLWCWYEQYQSNMIFANLRKDKKSGQVVTEEHKIPHGRWFQRVSSPHRMFEVLMYTILVFLIPTKTFFCIYLWVLGNQDIGITPISWSVTETIAAPALSEIPKRSNVLATATYDVPGSTELLEEDRFQYVDDIAKDTNGSASSRLVQENLQQLSCK